MEEIKNQEPEIVFKETKILSFGELLIDIDSSIVEEGPVYQIKKQWLILLIYY